MATRDLEVSRFKYLDGLRGVAALVVFNSHLLISTLPAVITFQSGEIHSSYDIPFGLSPLRFLFSGNFAVCIFFVLSGFVLSNLSANSALGLPAQIARRYLRLAVPMLITSTFAWALLALHLYGNFDAAVNVTKSGWLSAWYRFDPSFIRMTWESLVGAFIRGRADYNSNLWTMKIELIGSVSVFVMYAFCKSRGLRTGISIAYNVFEPLSYYGLFLIGAILYDWHATSIRSLGLPAAVKEPIAVLCFIVGLWMGSFPELQPGMTSPWHQWISGYDNPLLWHMLGAATVVTALIASNSLKRIFSCQIGIFLGKISFVLYLVHLPIICSVTAYVANGMRGESYLSVFLACSSVTIFAVIGVSALLYRVVDQQTTVFSRRMGYKINEFFRSNLTLSR